ncbi:HAD-superfamily hydrolase, subfamily IA, variant 3 [Sulfurimonas gotlandica GD1]|jgi:HAD superfamily hydrolase (TIGR01509 family)|uniref:phosphoglycolate phosphatase n=1 Tax=Sulfurimonas gotlandica (strain DSM 19862 / JCM 16533 / GD1) TaxID=929558 RepID=B6BGI3_SULGG|nr:HAD family phosphatase [Sulfurimonas gotlandica]EDZ62989.1 HAD-superfamily hydrolase, subfamily IA, variant 1 [Sulfurimonas gotlandica GD1]EHP29611.1 HAD-superfamily hydrolase, subfamily IA, variant 3 [Sulfurimonas gotlandica GD1]
MSRKKFLLFDNDGVLVETENWYYEANVKALAEIDIELTFDVYMEIMARGGTAWEVARAQNISEEIITKKREQRDVYYREFIRTEHIEIYGVVETLEELKKEYSMGIITTARRVDFDLIHNDRDIIKFMDFSLCVEEYPRSKPHPDPYLAGMKKFNASKDECLVIEDSQRGLSSAVNAEIECAIVENEFTKTHDFSKATYNIKKFSDLPELLRIVS